MQARFFTATNGARIGYAVLGSGPPLVFVPPWTSHLEALWALDGHRRFCERLAERHTLVLYDRWGCGLSDRARTDPSLDADVAVLVDVITHLRLRRVALFGPSAGGPSRSPTPTASRRT